MTAVLELEADQQKDSVGVSAKRFLLLRRRFRKTFHRYIIPNLVFGLLNLMKIYFDNQQKNFDNQQKKF